AERLQGFAGTQPRTVGDLVELTGGHAGPRPEARVLHVAAYVRKERLRYAGDDPGYFLRRCRRDHQERRDRDGAVRADSTPHAGYSTSACVDISAHEPVRITTRAPATADALRYRQ